MATNARGAVSASLNREDNLGFQQRSLLSRLPQFNLSGHTVLTPLFMFTMGISAFPVCETLLLQTSMFTHCFGYSGFYGEATMALFLVGLPLMMAQNRWDQYYDTMSAERWGGAQAASIFRVVIGHILQLVSLAFFFSRLTNDSSAGDRHALLLVSFVVIGLGCATVYGTYAQTVSLFPKKYHPFFFVGTYSVSWAIAPVNLALGELCIGDDPGERSAATASAGGVGKPVPDWDKIYGFYGVGSMLNVVGAAVFVLFVCRTQRGESAFRSKNDQLKGTLSDGLLSASPSSSFSSSEQQPSTVSDWVTRAESGGPTVGAGGSLQKVVSAPPLSSAEVWGRCLWIGGVMVVGLLENLLVCGEFARLPVQGQIPSLRTLMMYSFYAAQCVGAMVAMNKALQELLTARLIAVVTFLRLPGVALIYAYTRQGQCGKASVPEVPCNWFDSDVWVCIFFSLYIFVGGLAYTHCFSLATLLFEHAADRALCATVMNVMYYAGVCVASVIILSTV